MAVIDIAGFIADLKDHASEHGFHIHDERHFVETYSMRQAFEVDFHPADACGGPLDLHLSVDLDPRVLLAFEDEVVSIGPDGRPSDDLRLPVMFNWGLPPLAVSPDLLVLATELAGVGGADFPLEVSAADIVNALRVEGEPMRSLTIVAKVELTLASIFLGEEELCEVLDTCYQVSEFILQRSPNWVGDDWQPEL